MNASGHPLPVDGGHFFQIVAPMVTVGIFVICAVQDHTIVLLMRVMEALPCLAHKYRTPTPRVAG